MKFLVIILKKRNQFKFNFGIFLGPEPEEEVSEAEETSKEGKTSKKEAVEAEDDLKKEEVEPESDDEDQLVIFFKSIKN